MKVNRQGSDENVLIRIPFPGKIHEAWREEKVYHEVMAMTFIQEHTNILVPRIRYWGFTKESPEQLGPFIVMDFIKDEDLSAFLAEPTEDESALVFLDQTIDNDKLDKIYEQIAGFMLEPSKFEFPLIGSLSKDGTCGGEWVVTKRPLTYDMNEVVTVGGCSEKLFDGRALFDRSEDYFLACAKSFQAHLWEQRNISGDDEELA